MKYKQELTLSCFIELINECYIEKIILHNVNIYGKLNH